MPFQKNLLERTSNIELLRVLAIFAVLILHFNMVCGAWIPASHINTQFGIALEVLCICAVNLFVMISGYFMVDKEQVSLKKPVLLIVQLIMVDFAAQVALQVYSSGISSLTLVDIVCYLIPNDYFVMLYSTVYVFSPFINRAINSENTAVLRRVALLMFVLFSVWTFGIDIIGKLLFISVNESSTVSSLGSIYGYTVVNFVMCYVVGATVRKKIVYFKHPLILYFASSIISFLIIKIDFKIAIGYYSPFAIIQAMSLLMAAEKVHFNSKIVNVLAKAAFMVYLTHMYVLRYIFDGEYVTTSFFITFAYLIAVYVIGFIVYVAYQLVFGRVEKALGNKLDKIVITSV